MGKNPKINSSTDRNKAELVGKISKINSSTGTLIQERRVLHSLLIFPLWRKEGGCCVLCTCTTAHKCEMRQAICTAINKEGGVRMRKDI